MLTVHDTPTIRNAIMKRLDREPFLDSVNVTFRKYPGDHIEVECDIHVCWIGDRLFQVISTFDLPDPFEHSHLLNEIDQVAEGVKAARRDFFGRSLGGLIIKPHVQLAGTGRRGLWKQYGLRHV